MNLIKDSDEFLFYLYEILTQICFFLMNNSYSYHLSWSLFCARNERAKQFYCTFKMRLLGLKYDKILYMINLNKHNLIDVGIKQ